MPARPHAADAITVPDTGADADIDIDAGLAALRARGAQRFDPSGFRYLEALQSRARPQQGRLRDVLARRLAQAVQCFAARYDAAIAALDAELPGLLQHHPQAAAELRCLRAAGDVGAVRRQLAQLAARPSDGPLAALLRALDGAPDAQQPARDPGQPAVVRSPGTAALPELKTVQRFRDTWSRLRLDEQMARSQRQAPDNPGPLNSHLLVLRSLRCMQDIAPAYLARFMAHAEALSWLETADVPQPARSGKPAAARERRAGKPAVRRSR